VTVQEKQLTVEEFWQLFEGKPYELVHGEVMEITPGVYNHGVTANLIGTILRNFIDRLKLGQIVGAETGFQLSKKTLRAPDAAFISNEKLKTITDQDKYLPFAPDLAVEVVSKHDTADEVQDKVNLYLAAGTSLVWLLYANLEQVVVHRADRTSKTISRDGILEGEDLLPGLVIRVSDLFPPQSE